jgi:threonylcarbamoyladenosine tRNA methylthiotransferase MtaB
LAFVRAMPFGYLHLFPFSPRPGTKGWALHAESPVAQQVVDTRMATLRALAAEKSRAHRERFIGRELECISLHTPAELFVRSRTSALTNNFLPLEIDGQFAANQLLAVRIAGMDPSGTLQAVASALTER